jgi:hypothetical protein
MRILIGHLEVSGTEFRRTMHPIICRSKGACLKIRKMLALINEIIRKNERSYLRPDYMRAL